MLSTNVIVGAVGLVAMAVNAEVTVTVTVTDCGATSAATPTLPAVYSTPAVIVSTASTSTFEEPFPQCWFLPSCPITTTSIPTGSSLSGRATTNLVLTPAATSIIVASTPAVPDYTQVAATGSSSDSIVATSLNSAIGSSSVASSLTSAVGTSTSVVATSGTATEASATTSSTAVATGGAMGGNAQGSLAIFVGALVAGIFA